LPGRRVAFTGLGVVSALGPDLTSFREGLFAGRPGIRPIATPLPGPLRFLNGAEVAGFDALAHFEQKALALLDPFAQYAIVAAREAVRESGITFSAERTGIVTGTGGGGQRATDDGFVDLYKRDLPRVNPFTIPRIMANSAASHISMEFGIRGPVFTVSTACSSSNHAIGQALWLLRNGACDAVLAGGSESVFSYGFLKSWEAMRVVSSDTCRPFSKDRSGLILGEGAGMLVLEDMDQARARGARVYAELAGFGMSSDAHHITQPSVEGAVLAMRSALTDAGVAPEQIGYINAHGTATAANDPAETAAIRSVFGSHADSLCVSSTKSMHGHALGAAGALEAVATALALHEGCIPPTANFNERDPACDLDVVPNAARVRQAGWAMSNSFAFGGLNAVLVFRATDPLP
jgi:nodulation protein E